MREHLVFLLAAPIASFGSYAGHERRGSELVPLRSAVLGLMGAALGIERSDSKGQDRLQSYSVAVQSFQRSVPLRDFHTVQTVPTTKVKRPKTRSLAIELAGGDANTVITIRDYRCDVMVGTALWGDGHWELEALAGYLRRPVYPLYLGRKSCPLTTPLNPVVCFARDPVEALKTVEVPDWQHATRFKEQDRSQFPVQSDPVEGIGRPDMIERVPGQPLDRKTWTFGECAVWHFNLDKSERKGTGGGT